MSMKVFNLGCTHEHSFEGWFGSADEFDTQLASGLVECPICGDKAIRKLPAAPRLNLSSGHEPTQAQAQTPTPEQLQSMWLRMARYVRENTEDVGERFAEEARRIHYREAPNRGIRGVASREDASELADEGIEVFSFPMPKGSTEPIQ
jgi:hypothetical protein